jgi:uridine kinase
MCCRCRKSLGEHASSSEMPDTLRVMKPTPLVKTLHTLIRDQTTVRSYTISGAACLSLKVPLFPFIREAADIRNVIPQERDVFVFHAARLSRLLLEYAVSLLPYVETSVRGADGHVFQGCRFAGKVSWLLHLQMLSHHREIMQLCGVSIMRAGLALEEPLRNVCKDIALGMVE